MKNGLRTALLALLALSIVACGGLTEVRLGAIISLQGPASASGRAIQNGIELAVERINEPGPHPVFGERETGGVLVADTSQRVPLEMEYRDARNDPQQGVRHAQELIEMGIPAVIGAVTSDVTLAIAPVFQQNEVILLSPSASSPKLSGAGSYIYRNYPSDELEAVNTANHIYNQAGIQELAIVASQSEYGMGVKNAFIQRYRALGGRIAIHETFEPGAGAPAFERAAAQVAEMGAAGVYLAGYTAEVAAAARALREAGVELPLFGTGAIIPANLVAGGGDAVEGFVYPTTVFSPDSDSEQVQAFVEAYRAKFGETPDTYAAHGYDAVNIIVQAVEQSGTQPSDISFYMNTMNPFQGAAGLTDFDDAGNVRKFHRMFVIRGGEAVPLDRDGSEDGEEGTGDTGATS